MRILLYLFLFILLFVYSLSQLYDGDIGHHIRSGEWMLANGKILERDIFSYTAHGRKWLNHSWLAEIILCCVYYASGINGLIFFKIIMLLLSYALLVRASYLILNKKDIGSDLIIACLFIMSAVSASARFMVRPLIFTFLGVSVSMYIFARARSNINFLFLMPPLILLWVNLHAEFVLGVIMVALFYMCAAWSFIKEILKKKLSPAKKGYMEKCTLILLLSILASILSPHGIDIFVHQKELTTSDLFMGSISEWLPAMHQIFRGQVFVKVFYWFLGIGFLSFLLNFRKKDTVFFLFFMTVGIMALASIRFMPYLTMIGIPAAAENLEELKRKTAGRLSRRAVFSAKDKAIFHFKRAAAFGIIIFIIFLIERRASCYSEFGLGLGERVCYPVDAAEFVEEAGVGGNMFNMVDYGGYLIWMYPERSVFADGRLDVYGERIYRDFLEPTEEVFERYNINYIFLSFRHPVVRGLLYKNENWPLIYWDDIALIYAKRNEKNKGLIARYGYNRIHPLTGSLGFLSGADPEAKNEIWKEIHRALRLSPNSIRAHVVLGDAYVELQDFRSAISAYEQAIRLGKRQDVEYMMKVYHNLGRLHHNLKEYAKSEHYYRTVIKMAKKGGSTYNQALEDWGILAYAQGEKHSAFRLIKAAGKYKRRSSGYIFSDYPRTLATLALLYEDFGKKDKALIAWQQVYKTGTGEIRAQALEHISKIKNNG